MRQFAQSMAVCALALFGLWGCAQSPETSEDSDKSEEKIARLEKDLRSTRAANEQYVQRISVAESALAQTRQQLKLENEKLTLVLKEQELLRSALKQCTAERDLLAKEYNGFRKNLQDLLTQSETVVPSKSSTSAIAPTNEAPMPREVKTSIEEVSGPRLQ